MENNTGSDQAYIVYVDDDADDLEMIAHALGTLDLSAKFQGYLDAGSALDFLHSIEQGGRLPSLMVLDLNMPGLTGAQALQTLKEDPQYQDIPVVIFTNSDHPDHRKSVLAMGAEDFITKPYRYADIQKVCSTFVGYLDRPPQRK